MRYERDPMSVRYDPAAGRLLGRAYARPGSWVTTEIKRPDPGPRTREWLREQGINLFLTDAGGLTTYERAFQRSLYYSHHGGGGRVNPVWSLQRQWGNLTPAGRLLQVRVGPAADGRLAVRRHRGQAWVAHPELQSGGIGSPKQRFPA